MTYNSDSKIDLHTANKISSHWGIGCVSTIEDLNLGTLNKCTKLHLTNKKIALLRYRITNNNTSFLRTSQDRTFKELYIYRELKHKLIPLPSWVNGDVTRDLLPYPYLIMEWVNGVQLNSVLEFVDKKTSLKLMKDLATYLSIIHTSFSNDNTHSNKFIPVIRHDHFDIEKRLTKKLIKVISCLPDQLHAKILHINKHGLETLPQNPSLGLLHGDFCGQNILIDVSGKQMSVNAIIDFEHAHWGMIEYDLAKMDKWTTQEKKYLWDYFVKNYCEQVSLPDGLNIRLKMWRTEIALDYLGWAIEQDQIAHCKLALQMLNDLALS